MTTATLTDAVVRWSVNQLARREKLHASTVWRWMLSGVRGTKLRSIRVGGRRFILENDWLAFSAALNADLADAPSAPTPAAVSARSERARHELDKLIGNDSARRTAGVK